MTERILVTGGTGFIGRHLVARLVHSGHNVRVLTRSVPNGHIGSKVEYVAGDIQEEAAVARAMQGVTYVYHLAVTTTPGNSNKKIKFDARSNIVGSLNVFEAGAQAGVERIIFTSSGGSIYGPAEKTPIPEDHPLNPITAHGIGKLAVERYLDIYRQEQGLEYRIVRGGNPYGEGQDPFRGQGFIPAAMERMSLDEPIVIWGDGSVVRDFFYVGDLVEALLLLMKDDGQRRIYNVGSGEGRSLLQIVREIERVCGKRARLSFQQGRGGDVPVNVLSIDRIRTHLDWEPKVKLEEGLERTWRWIQDRIQAVDPKQVWV